MAVILNLNDFMYHSVEVLICDVRLVFLNARRILRLKKIARLEEMLNK